MKKTLLLILLFLAITVADAVSAIIFEDNFDARPDWNTSGQYEGYECGVMAPYGDAVNDCSPGTYPQGYDAFRSMPYISGTGNPMASIRRLPGNLADHTGTGTGKAFIAFYQSNGQTGTKNLGYWAGDSIIGKFFTQHYPELYVRVWIKTQVGWRWRRESDGSGISNAQAKIVRVGHYFDGASANIFNMFANNHPNMIYDWCDIGYASSYRCDPTTGTDWYYCANQNNAYQKNDTQLTWGGGAQWDGNWHRYDFRFKFNTIGQYDGVWEWWFDGNLVESKTNVSWIQSGSSATGLNYIMLGGNSNNALNTPPVDQWMAFDDLVVSTTPIAADYIPAGGGADTTPPVLSNGSPSGTLSAGTTQVTMSATTNENATCKWSATAGVDYAAMSGAFTTTGGTSHNVTITGLSNGQSYTRYVKCSDAAGNTNAGDYPVAWSVSSASVANGKINASGKFSFH